MVDILHDICTMTNHSWGIEVLVYENMNVELSNAFINIFAEMFWMHRNAHLQVHMGIYDNGKCFTYATVDNSCSGKITLTLTTPSFLQSFSSWSTYYKPHSQLNSFML